jgi:hypothetical protein
MKKHPRHYSITLIFLVCNLFARAVIADNAPIDFDNIDYPSGNQETFTAIIKKIEERKWIYGSGTTLGIILTVICFNKKFTVPVAPVWYLPDNNEFTPNLKIQITGVRRLVRGTNIILPKLIKIGNSEVLLRNYDGKPFWNGSNDYKGYRTNIHRRGKNRGMRGRGNRKGWGNFQK